VTDWRKTEDGLPDPGVLVWTVGVGFGGEPAARWMRKDSGPLYWVDHDERETLMYDITHWHPLPELPEDPR
jgi:hypothetical protein